MSERPYASPVAGLPSQSELLTSRAVFTDSYAVIPRSVMRDIVTSRFPFWENTRAWVLARPMSGRRVTLRQRLGDGETVPDERYRLALVDLPLVVLPLVNLQRRHRAGRRCFSQKVVPIGAMPVRLPGFVAEAEGRQHHVAAQ